MLRQTVIQSSRSKPTHICCTRCWGKTDVSTDVSAFILAVLSASFYTSPRAIFLRQIISFHFPVQNLVTASHDTEDRSPSPQCGSPSSGLCLPLELLSLCICYTPAWNLLPLPTSSSSFRPQLKLLLKCHFFKALPI